MLTRVRPVRHVLRRPFSSEVIAATTDALQQIHTLLGLPWWACVPAVCVALRASVTLPLAVYQRRLVQRQTLLRPLVSAWAPVLRLKLAAQAQRLRKVGQETGAVLELTSMTGDHVRLLAAKEQRRRQKRLFAKYHCQLWKTLLLPTVQLPLWVVMLGTLRRLCGWDSAFLMQGVQLAGLMEALLLHEGVAWIHDLLVADPYGVLPVVVGAAALANIEWHAWTLRRLRLALQSGTGVRGNALVRPTMGDAAVNLLRLLVVILMTAVAQAPAVLGLYWATLHSFSLLQNVALDRVLPLGYVPRS